MSTPDELAAALPPPAWKSRPLPAIGRKVKIKYPVKRTGRTGWEIASGIVEQVSQPSATGLVITLDDHKSYLIDSGSLLDRWEYTDSSGQDAQTRLANDSLHRHPWEMIQPQINSAAPVADENPFGEDLSAEPQENVAPGVPDPYGESLASRLRRLEYLDDQIKTHEAEIKGLADEYNELCSVVMEHMAQEGVPSITVDGNTWFMKGKTYVEKLDGVTTEDIREALIASGYGSMVTQTYNSNSLRSLLTEFRDSDGQIPVPDALAAVVRLGETPTIGRTRAAARKRKAPVSPTP